MNVIPLSGKNVRNISNGRSFGFGMALEIALWAENDDTTDYFFYYMDTDKVRGLMGLWRGLVSVELV